MRVEVFDSKRELGRASARDAAEVIRASIAARGEARVVAATGASQFELLDALTREEGIDWGRVTFFHLDEYVGLPESHPASFRKYLKERLAERIRPGAFHFIDRKSTRLNSSHANISYAVFCLKKKKYYAFDLALSLLTSSP